MKIAWAHSVAIAFLWLNAASAFAEERPNLLFIIVDDLNDMPLAPAGKPHVPTPNIDRLARSGITFTNAHTNDPICAPARACMLFGLYPQTTGLYWFENWKQNGILNRCVSLNSHMQRNNYSVFGTGKIYHGNNSDGAFDEYGPKPSVGPWPWDGKSKQTHNPHPDMMYMYDAEADGDMDYKWEHHFGPLSKIPSWPADAEQGVPGYTGWRLYRKPFKYINDQDRDLLADERMAEWSVEILRRKHEKPFALFTGFVRTHTPLYAPQEYFDRFPLDSIEVPERFENDLEDCAKALSDSSLYGFRRYKMLTRYKDKDLYREWLQAYMACVSFVDDQVGKVLDALEASPYRDNTIVIFTSDHGFHIGEKENIYKQTLWDGGTRIPLIVSGVPGIEPDSTCQLPVSLIDLYPTINELCQLPKDPNRDGSGYALEGSSLAPLLTGRDADWTGREVAVSALPGKDHSQHVRHGGTWFPHFSVRSKRYRYTLCSSGEEELYDFESDPREWKNLSTNPDYADIKASLREQLVTLRDGADWRELGISDLICRTLKNGAHESDGVIRLKGQSEMSALISDAHRDFEIEYEVRTDELGSLQFVYHATRQGNSLEGTIAAVPPQTSNLEGVPVPYDGTDWNHVRIRVVAGRCQVWVNHRVHSDLVGKSGSGQLGWRLDSADIAILELRNIRIRSFK